MKLQPYIFPQKETNKNRDICFHIKHLTDWKSRQIKKLLETNDDKCSDGPVLLLGACWQTCIICQEIRQQSFFSSTSSKQSSGAILSNIHSTRLFTLEAGTLNYGWGQDKPQYFILKHILFVPSIHRNKGEWRVQLFWWHVTLSWQLHMSQAFFFFFAPRFFHSLRTISTKCQTWQNWVGMSAAHSLMFFCTRICHCLLIPYSMGAL